MKRFSIKNFAENKKPILIDLSSLNKAYPNLLQKILVQPSNKKLKCFPLSFN